MTIYKVVYEIEVDAETPEEAALQVEETLKNMNHRPYFEVTDLDTSIVTKVDLDAEPVSE